MSPYRTGNFITAADELLKVIYLLKRYDFNALLNSFSPIDLVGGSPIVHVFMIFIFFISLFPYKIWQ